jgi:vancomycin resistance protein VanJ
LSRFLHSARKWVTALCVLYALGLATHLALRSIFGDARWWLEFTNIFTPWYFMPVIVLLPLAVITRARRAALVMTLAGIVGALWIAPYYLPKVQATPTTQALSLRVVTFNTWGGNTHFVENGYGAIGDWLRDVDADIVLLQEVPLSQRSRADGVLGLRELYPQQFATETDGWTNALLTRLPVLSSESHETDGDQPRYQRIIVELDGTQIAIYNVHLRYPIYAPRFAPPFLPSPYLYMMLGYDASERNRQIAYLLRLLEGETLPYIVGGDFNTSDQTAIYHMLTTYMTDSFREAGIGLGTSWPVSTARTDIPSLLPPLIRIDYIWHSETLAAQAAWQGPRLGSDHLPLVADIRRDF